MATTNAFGNLMKGFSSIYFPAKQAQKQRTLKESIRQVTQKAETQRLANRGGPSTDTENVGGVPNAGEFGAFASFRKGGRIKKTGIYMLHKNEIIIPAEILRKLDKVRKSSRNGSRRMRNR